MKPLDLSKVSLQTERNFKLTPYHIPTATLKFTLFWTSDEELAKENPEWNTIAHFSAEPSLADKKAWLARSLIDEWVEKYKPDIKSILRQAWRENPNSALTLKVAHQVPTKTLDSLTLDSFNIRREEHCDPRNGRDIIWYTASLKRPPDLPIDLGTFTQESPLTIEQLRERINWLVDEGRLSVGELT